MLTDHPAGSRWEAGLFEFADAAVGPRATEIDRTDQYPADIFRALADRGLLAVSLPAEFGGPDPDDPERPGGVRALAQATRVMAQYSSAVGLMLLLSRLPAAPVLVGGTAEQRRELLVPLGTGDTRGAFCMSEPQAGSDVLGLTTTAVPAGSGWRLSGRKAWVSGLAEADWYVVVATVTDPALRSPGGLRAFVVPKDTPGVRISALHQRNAVRGISLGDLHLDGVLLPDRALLPGITGIGPLLRALATMRPVVASRGVGLAQGALQLAVEHARQRQIAGGALVDQQGMLWQLARAAADVEAAALLVERAAELVDLGRTGPDDAGRLAIAKLSATECAVRVSGLATQVFGAAGLVSGHPAERMYRDARSLTVVEGTTEMQLSIIGRSLAARDLWWRPE